MGGSRGSAESQEFFRQKRAAAIFKHGVLQRYVVPWAMKTGSTSTHHRVVVVDGYAGAGLYDDGSPGSPILMARIARKMRPSRNIDLVFVEKDGGTFAQLKENLASGGFHLDHEPLRGRLEDHLDAVLEYATGVPTFVFLDPYGMGLSYDVITQRILGTR